MKVLNKRLGAYGRNFKMFTIKFVKSTDCFILENTNDLSNYVDYQFINKFYFENGMMSKDEFIGTITDLANRNNVQEYEFLGLC
jgi:hypothetical protein